MKGAAQLWTIYLMSNIISHFCVEEWNHSSYCHPCPKGRVQELNTMSNVGKVPTSTLFICIFKEIWLFKKLSSEMMKVLCFRYMSILHPLTPRLTTRHSLLIILTIWIISIIICSPDMVLIQYEANITSGAQCFISKRQLSVLMQLRLQNRLKDSSSSSWHRLLQTFYCILSLHFILLSSCHLQCYLEKVFIWKHTKNVF